MSLQFSCCATWLALIQKDLTILDKLVNFQRLLSLLSMRNLKSNQTIAQTLNSIQLFNTYKIQKIPLAFCITKNKLPPSSSRKFFRCSPILAWPKLPLPISSPKSKTSKTVSFDWWGWGVGWDESKKCNKRFFAGQWRADTRCCCCSCSCCSCCCCFRDSSLWKHCCVLEEMKEHQQSGKRRARPLKGCNYSALLKVQWITLKSPFNSESITQPAKKKNHIIIFGYYLINTRFHTQVMTLLNQDPMRAAGLNLCEFACGMSETSEILPTPRPKVATSHLKIWACLKSKDLV